ncbi:MAG: tetratricopeptide repeat protein [Candidatus Melainabacteria bacterium]|nr:tetratricopeptide repeat protein [Candidatus Melainabacteria bacterium]
MSTASKKEIKSEYANQRSASVHIMENHDRSYYVWKESGVKNRRLVHIDAHHDMWFIKKGSQITIANFICRALEEDILKEVFWIVPDESMESQKNKKAILQHLKRIIRRYPESSKKIKIDKDEISAFVLNKPLRICTLDSIPEITEDVLLDIDVDYMIIPHVSYGKTDKHSEIPWCWPNELLNRINLKKIHSDIITIAYSVEGGYTPLKWKYLGDELALRIKNGNSSSLRMMEMVKEASILANDDKFLLAEAKYIEAKDLMPASPVPCFHLALLNQNMNKVQESQSYYKQALNIDPSYRTAYNNLAYVYFEDKLFRKAEIEVNKVLSLDPEDANAHLILGLIAMKKKNWKEAEDFICNSIRLNENLPDAYHALGDIQKKQNKTNEAINLFEKSLKLSLKGYRSLNAFILSRAKENFLTDPDYFEVHVKLAKLYAKKNLTTKAISSYKIGIAGGHYSTMIYIHLALLYLKEKKVKQALSELLESVKVFPEEVINIFSELLESLDRIKQ